MINIPMEGASAFKKINEINVGDNREKIIRTIDQAYNKAPYYAEISPMVFELIRYNTDNLASLVTNSIIKISDYLQLKTDFILSSKIKKDKSSGQVLLP